MKKTLILSVCFLGSVAFAQMPSTAMQFFNFSNEIEKKVYQVAKEQVFKTDADKNILDPRTLLVGQFVRSALDGISLYSKLELFEKDLQSISVFQSEIEGPGLLRNERADRLWVRVYFKDESFLTFTASVSPKFVKELLKNGKLETDDRVYFNSFSQIKDLLSLFYDPRQLTAHDGKNVHINVREFPVSEYSSHLEAAKEWVRRTEK